MQKFIFIFGGARSGKSSYAVALAKRLKKKVAFIATATSPDVEMKKRIKLHRTARPRQWELIEEGNVVITPLDIGLYADSDVETIRKWFK